MSGVLTLCPYVREVFAVTNLDTILQIQQTEVGG
jgi:hypothetical protein